MNLLTPYLSAIKIGLVLILTVAIAAGFLAFCSHERGIGEATVQSAWDKADALLVKSRQARIDAARAASDRLQAQANEDRRKENEAAKERENRLSARLDVALSELRKRPERPAPSPGATVPQPAITGPQGLGCTGAGLYRDDGEFLTRLADRAQRLREQLREQRDACYQAVDRARQEIDRLNSSAPQEAH